MENLNEIDGDRRLDKCVNGKVAYKITDLDEYSLINIFRYLTLRDQIILAWTVPHFKHIFMRQCSNDTIYDVDFSHKKWSLTQLCNAFELIGPITKSFRIKYSETLCRVHLVIDFILEYCNNLLELNLECVSFANKFVEQIANNLKNVVRLELKFCSLIDNDIKILGELKNLQHLDVTQNYKLTGKHMETFSGLKTLKVGECCEIEENNFAQMFSQMISLEYLDMRKCSHVQDKAINALVDTCKQIRVLKIYMRNATETFKRISELKHLDALDLEEGWNCVPLHETIRLRNIVNDTLGMLSSQLKSLKIHFLQLDHDNGLNAARFKTIYSFQNLAQLHFIGYLSCYVIGWSDLSQYIKSSNLKVLNITYSNNALGFCSADFNSFITNCTTTQKLNEINLNYSSIFQYARFLDEFYSTLDGKMHTKPIIRMKITVNENCKSEILNNPKYLAAHDLSNLIIQDARTLAYDHGPYIVYEQNEEIPLFNDVAEIERGEMKIVLNSNVL